VGVAAGGCVDGERWVAGGCGAVEYVYDDELKKNDLQAANDAC